MRTIPTATRKPEVVRRHPPEGGVHEVYTAEELDFLKAVDAYKRENRRPFPSCSEILAILLSLGYRKTAPSRSLFRRPAA